jgi:undecaprenyl-diphosphatase
MDQLLQLDRNILIFLNNLGSEQFDFLWLMITKKPYWTPFYLILAYFIYKKLGVKNFLIIIVFVAILLTIGNELVEFFKNNVKRLRPCNDPEVKDLIRVVHHSKSFSFFSGHATNSISTMVFVYLILKKHYKYAYLVFLYPLIFAYSRIYLGVHFPSDILTGYLVGALLGFLCFKSYDWFMSRKTLTN